MSNNQSNQILEALNYLKKLGEEELKELFLKDFPKKDSIRNSILSLKNIRKKELKDFTRRLLKKKYSDIYKFATFENIIFINNKRETNQDIQKMIINFHNEGILPDFMEKVNLKKLPDNFSDFTNIHNKKYFDILSEIKDNELFFSIYENIDFKLFDSIDKDELIKIFNEDPIIIWPYNLGSEVISKTFESLEKQLKSIEAGDKEERFLLQEDVANVNIDHITDIEFLEPNMKILSLIHTLLSLQNHAREHHGYLVRSDIKIINKFLEYDIFSTYKDAIRSFINECEVHHNNCLAKIKKEIISKIKKINQDKKIDDFCGKYISVGEEIKILFDNQIKDYNLREKFLELDEEILNIILNPEFNFHNLDKSIIEKFLSISKEDILNNVFFDSENTKKEDIISYVNELWIKEIKPDIDNKKLNILKNYENLYTFLNNENKDPLDIFMKRGYLINLLSSSRELLKSFDTKYKNNKEECLKQLSNIGDLLIDFKPQNQELFNALQEFLPNLSEDEFNKCESVDKLIQLISEPNKKLNMTSSNAVNPNSHKL